MPDNVYPFMISCAQRREERAKTLSQLAQTITLDVDVLEMPCEPPSTEANRWGAFTGAERALDHGAGMLFLEDDIDINLETFDDLVDYAQWSGYITTFCIMRDRLYPDGFERDWKREAKSRGGTGYASLVRLPRGPSEARRGFHGSQALYLPPHALWAILRNQEAFVNKDGTQKEPGTIPHGFDFWVKENAWGSDLGGIYAAYPNPVQHRSVAPSMFGGTGTFQSASFGLPSEVYPELVFHILPGDLTG